MRRNKPGRPATGRTEVKAHLTPGELAELRGLVRGGAARSLSRAVVEACMVWSEHVLGMPGVREESSAKPRREATRSASGYLSVDQAQRWSLAVDRARMPSGATAATVAILRWMKAPANR